MIIPREALLFHTTPHWWVIASSQRRWSTMEHRRSKVTIIRRRNRAWLSFNSIWRKKSLFSSRRLPINRWKCVNNGANRWTFFFRSSASPWIWLIYGVFRIYATRTAEVRSGPELCFLLLTDTAIYLGAFLIPYALSVILGGMPLFYLELLLGQYYRQGAITCWRKICPLLAGIGWAVTVIAFYTDFYYNVVISWALYYLFASFRKILPWSECST